MVNFYPLSVYSYCRMRPAGISDLFEKGFYYSLRVFMKCFKFFILLFIFTSSIAFGQIPPQEAYDLLQDEAHLLARYSSDKPDAAALLDSAEVYACDSLWSIATVFLQQYMDDLKQKPVVSTPHLSSPARSDPADWRIVSGIDFNRQEFEMGFLQTDSVLNEQLSKPFVGIELKKNLQNSTKSNFNLFSHIRYDKENFTGGLNLNGNFYFETIHLNLQAGALYDRNSLYPEFTFLEGNSRQDVLWQISRNWEMRSENYLRYKKYKQPSQDIPDFVNDLLRVDINYNQKFIFVSEINYNESQNYDNNDYLEKNLYLQSFGRFFKRLRINFRGGIRLNRFAYSLQDSTIHNKSRSVFTDLQSILPWGSSWRWKLEWHTKFKNFEKVSEQDADYQQHQIRSLLRRQLFTYFSWEAGYLGELRKYKEFTGAQGAYIREQNYYENGMILGMDYQNFNNLFISFSASYGLRRYPQAVTDADFSLYNNRNILNINLLMQIPILPRLDFNFLASYDNDRDLDSDENNTRSSIFSAEIQYQF